VPVLIGTCAFSFAFLFLFTLQPTKLRPEFSRQSLNLALLRYSIARFMASTPNSSQGGLNVPLPAVHNIATSSGASAGRQIMVDNSWQSLVSSSAVSTSLEPLRQIVNLDGRVTFPAENPQQTTHWTLAKWRDTLLLGAFDPVDELQLEEWVEKTESSLKALMPALSTFLAVVELKCGSTLVPLLQLARADGDEITTLAAFASFVCSFLFDSMEGCRKVESELLLLKRQSSSFEAYQRFVLLVKRYGYLCERHGRCSILQPHQMSELFLGAVPMAVEDRFRMLYSIYQSPLRLLKSCMKVESELKRSGAWRPSVHFGESEEVQMESSQQEFPGLLASCINCGEIGHRRSRCPLPARRCARCRQLGHMSNFCDRGVLKDTSGKARAVITPKRDSYGIDFRLDNSSTEQLRSIAGQVDRLLRLRAAGNERTKVR
jgi:Zinc knuckle